jgi:hypothetical protein
LVIVWERNLGSLIEKEIVVHLLSKVYLQIAKIVILFVQKRFVFF